MDRKPWQNNGPHRAPFGSDRREGGRSDRREGGERGFGRREFGDRREFGGERRGFGERREFGDRREFGGDRGERRPFVAGERREFNGERRGFGDRRKSFGGGQRRREDFGVRSGPRARALETRRFSERSDFAKNAVVKLDADIADYFKPRLPPSPPKKPCSRKTSSRTRTWRLSPKLRKRLKPSPRTRPNKAL